MPAPKGHRIRWTGHVVRMDKEKTVKRTTEWSTIPVRRFGRQGSRWEDDIIADLGKMKVQNWSKMAIDRETRKIIGQQAKTHKEMQRRQKNTSTVE
jgi:pyridoxal biosynthesis lyase PdxS